MCIIGTKRRGSSRAAADRLRPSGMAELHPQSVEPHFPQNARVTVLPLSAFIECVWGSPFTRRLAAGSATAGEIGGASCPLTVAAMAACHHQWFGLRLEANRPAKASPRKALTILLTHLSIPPFLCPKLDVIASVLHI